MAALPRRGGRLRRRRLAHPAVRGGSDNGCRRRRRRSRVHGAAGARRRGGARAAADGRRGGAAAGTLEPPAPGAGSGGGRGRRRRSAPLVVGAGAAGDWRARGLGTRLLCCQPARPESSAGRTGLIARRAGSHFAAPRLPWHWHRTQLSVCVRVWVRRQARDLASAAGERAAHTLVVHGWQLAAPLSGARACSSLDLARSAPPPAAAPDGVYATAPNSIHSHFLAVQPAVTGRPVAASESAGGSLRFFLRLRCVWSLSGARLAFAFCLFGASLTSRKGWRTCPSGGGERSQLMFGNALPGAGVDALCQRASCRVRPSSLRGGCGSGSAAACADTGFGCGACGTSHAGLALPVGGGTHAQRTTQCLPMPSNPSLATRRHCQVGTQALETKAPEHQPLVGKEDKEDLFSSCCVCWGGGVCSFARGRGRRALPCMRT